ncbi:DNA mismatch repair protein MutT [Fusobacterium nucleatum subsp. nucleatum ATCC 25586]|uniref:DNA mismatch repair protein MutT n=1 Tax=Fusobacterium nucleatum subsp. nucleatum (strain ATCC 25586 / DSM 15643 / BCRC 10681 / CIP 101130 / JCM 8532 / KCTC 2640 / LMG 13131 / VPI 4355) TaxID=190304 RepID=Q8REJ4_FUSNN|nr:NUDIX domain-containing protein [Fusobacterium nucleatum]AAL95304.1 Phosphohydrolase (MUTT/NUDIX family protein) [Fusobacterium nucleatum subsp. nucleatum ATCC 25586]AVQ15459.1 DNA mismatch repair protein MutT [Fusobacterium nucleatum subsp. nucleatum ATCC 25586]WMS30386.1 NUDIX domain-containing protein [Fusobacterium nucleatum]
MEKFAVPCVAAIIEKIVNNEKYILIQTRQKEDGVETNGMLEIPAGKIREYENIFEALKREVKEETGLTITKILGEDRQVSNLIDGNEVISYTPYCVTQNLSGVYSIILNTFLCEAEGELLSETNESQNIHWMKIEDLKKILKNNPEKIFLLHINALQKYFKK